ncbi:Dna-binding bromodomain-containing protein [Thalictrum thalictroides]|uniref:Dna-binding bromodomain-containing protein n=1 Tax=Thalictrum thalictroides TaxID=46969 RepID=A0A7J6W088_THATH|nr:Dna-binding bromodomain-containing protein [Thalictrum thalictroides]
MQETSKYMSVIRQHLDLEIVNKRLQEGQYSGSSSKFFRDLLVLINNAIVYFSNNSVEFTAATELRQIVSKEMGLRIKKFNQSPETQEPAPPIIHPPALPKLDLEPSDSLLMKQKSSVPMIACRKRSSIIYKAAPERKVEKKETVVEDKKPVFDRKKQDNLLVNLAEEKIVMKKDKRDRPASGTRSSRTVSKNSNRNPSPSSNQASSSKGGIAAEDNSETKTDKEKNNNSTVAKKRSVANFLNRMKKNTSSNGTLLDSLKNSGNSSNNSKGGNAEQKKSSGGKGDVRKEQATRQSVSRRQTRDHTSPAKRSVGRPPKRNASSPITPLVPSKRSRETIETEAAASRQPRKRSRR